MKMNKNEFMKLLSDMKDSIYNNDSFEGAIKYELSDEPSIFEVEGVYRVGNSQGQGGVRHIPATENGKAEG